MRKGILLTLAIALAAAAQEPTGRIEGRVVNAVTGEPMADVDLSLRARPLGRDGANVVSDAEGRFVFDEMPPGQYTLMARGRGLTQEMYRGGPLKLAPGQVLAGIEFRLTPLALISGVVVDDQDKPVPKVAVAALGADALFVPFPRATTDDAGEFRLDGVYPGNYLLAATPPATKPVVTGESSKRKEELLVTYYPSSVDEVGAAPLQVMPGMELPGLKITLRRGLLFHVQGTVVSSSPDLAPGEVTLVLARRTALPTRIFSSSAPNTRSPAPDGSFDFGGVQPGSYELRATRMGKDGGITVVLGGSADPGIGGRVLLGRVPVDVVDTDATGVVLRIGKPLRLQGTLRMEGDVDADFTGALIALRPVDSAIGSVGGAKVGPGNAFTLEDVAQDKHVVSLVSGLPGNAYVRSIRLGSQDVLTSGLDLTGMGSAPSLDILVSPNGATVEGTVKRDEDQIAQSLRVSLVPESGRPEDAALMKSAVVAGDGRFSLKGVAPGEYRLYAYYPPRLAGVIDMVFFKPFESNAEKVDVDEGERKQVELKVVNPPEAR